VKVYKPWTLAGLRKAGKANARAYEVASAQWTEAQGRSGDPYVKAIRAWAKHLNRCYGVNVLKEGGRR